jgi:phenylpropionate dioxygenase-like ring-hydroxylating dioxygenase large terminal subunit
MTALATVGVAEQEHSTSQKAGFHQSWFPVALARELGPSNVLGVDFLGTRVVVYRDGQGRAIVQNAFCAHLGADLSIGEVVDGQIRCPFHHWRYGADGRCAHIPTGDKIPPGARIFTYPSAEAWGLIWAFNGETPLFELPRMPNAEEDDLIFEAHRRGIRPVDYWIATANAIDFQHLRSLHHLPAVDPEELAGSQYGFEYEVEAPGFFIRHGRITGTNNFTLHGRIGDHEMFGMFAGSPIANGKSMAYFGIGLRRTAAAELGSEAAVQERLNSFRAFIDDLAVQDNPIFETMRFRKGTLVASDRHLSRFLKYVSEFPRFQTPDA